MLPNHLKLSMKSFRQLQSRLSTTGATELDFIDKLTQKPTEKLIDNKRITRLESDIELDDDKTYKSRIINRNPRNLEQMAFDAKPKGFWLDKTMPSDWNRLIFEQNGRNLVAYLQHWSGKRLIETMTSEPGLSKYFRSPTTTQSAKILAQIMARRCLQAGYITVGYDIAGDDQLTGQKNKAFYESAESAGLTLKEFKEITPRCVTDL